MKPKHWLLLALVSLIGFILIQTLVWGWETPEQRKARFESYRKIEYANAVRCSGTPNARVAFEDIEWVITPGSKLRFVATDGTAVLDGWADTTHNLIYLPERHQAKRWILRHEVLHLLGYIDHPDHPFKTCRAMPEQNG